MSVYVCFGCQSFLNQLICYYIDHCQSGFEFDHPRCLGDLILCTRQVIKSVGMRLDKMKHREQHQKRRRVGNSPRGVSEHAPGPASE